MWTPSKIPTPAVVTGPAAEPVTLTEAKKQVELSPSDDSHDAQIAALIEAARQKWEHDTQEYYITRSMRLKLAYFSEIQFPHRPVSAITSITYYDTANASQTLASSVYELDSDRSQLRLAYEQTWPATVGRWDAVTVNYTLGSHTNSTTVPEIAKAAMKLLIGYYFDANRGENDSLHDLKAYERLVARYLRSNYP